jgi:2,4-dienoyl-CoA reductase-like NADH-dependent reductase (Old Yellow Enzyme family)
MSSTRVRQLRQQLFEIGRQIEAAVKQDFPIGARISWISHGSNRIGRVEGYGGFGPDTRLQVRTERTDKLVAVRLYSNPEVLP